jgi:hypothetical protein
LDIEEEVYNLEVLLKTTLLKDIINYISTTGEKLNIGLKVENKNYNLEFKGDSEIVKGKVSLNVNL